MQAQEAPRTARKLAPPAPPSGRPALALFLDAKKRSLWGERSVRSGAFDALRAFAKRYLGIEVKGIPFCSR